LAKQKYNVSFISKLNTTNFLSCRLLEPLKPTLETKQKCNCLLTLNGKPVHGERDWCIVFNEYFASISDFAVYDKRNVPPFHFVAYIIAYSL